MVEKLKKSALLAEVATLRDWRLADDGEAVEKDFRFANFREAFAFMTQVAFMAEKMDHHPEWRNVYNRVHVRLTTHSCGGVSTHDIVLARFIDGLG